MYLRRHVNLYTFICTDADALEIALRKERWTTQQRQQTNEQWRLRKNVVTLILYNDGRLIVDSNDQTAQHNKYNDLLNKYGPQLPKAVQQEMMDLE
jgi:ribonuclease HIII